MTRALARDLERLFERFAEESGFSASRRVEIYFRPGIFGHHQLGRAADIYAVGGVSISRWKADWDRSRIRAALAGQRGRAVLLRGEPIRNLGWRLYKVLQLFGRWAQPYGYPIQLFGPWTRSEGPWKYISDRLLYAHRDHIHVAK